MKVKYLREILQDVSTSEISDIGNILIKKIVFDSRKLEDGSLFVAIKGFTRDGHAYLSEAEQKGAVAAVVEKKNQNISIPQIVVKDSRKELARIAANFYSPELSKIRLIGITGTNGKTTTSYLIRAIIEAAGIDCGLIGTIGYDVAGEHIKAWNTTPESVDIFAMLSRMYQKGQKGCVLEVSSHALSLNRIDFLNFEVAVFTNLTQDHLDFHTNFEDYFNAKKKLFDHLKMGGYAVINIDDPYGKILLEDINKDTITFSISDSAMVRPLAWKSTIAGLKLQIKTPRGEIDVMTQLIGQFNMENILAAIASGMAMDFDLKTIKNGIEKVSGIPGRLETFKVDQKRTVIIDYAHTPDALQKSLKVLKELTLNTLWVVFGCGGDRDSAKRPIMGKIAESFADHIIITSDNPRSEAPESIADMIIKGISNSEKIYIELDRYKAIKYALDHSQTNDTILIAGKGHEDYQEIKGKKYPFDDRKVVKELLR